MAGWCNAATARENDSGFLVLFVLFGQFEAGLDVIFDIVVGSEQIGIELDGAVRAILPSRMEDFRI